MTSFVQVAVGIILNQHHEVLIALRDSSQHQGGLWEFPGGKVEPGENVEQALSRELREEVNIKVINCYPFQKVEHDYGDKDVILDVWVVDKHSGKAKGREGQAIKWVAINNLDDYQFPNANLAIIKAIKNSELLS